MDIDTNWCLNCGKQTNGELYCCSLCRNQDEKGLKLSSLPTEYGSFNDNSSMISGGSSPSSYNASSKYLNNPDKLLFYQGNDLKFRNRPNYDAGCCNPSVSSGLSQWLNQNDKVFRSCELTKKNMYNIEHGHLNHKYHQHGGFAITNGFKGSFSSNSSESSYSSSSETIIIGSSTSSNDSLSKGITVSNPYYPWNKTEEEDDDISLYEY